MLKGVFITGTTTGVGKTVAAACLLAAARAAGRDAVPMKPVQTGCTQDGGRLLAPDLDFCLRAAGLDPARMDCEAMAPYRFLPACSPHLAARAAGVAISIDQIQSSFEALLAGHDLVIVEGAGGVLVPLDESRTMLDLMRALSLPVLLAASPRLGTINHTLLSLKALRDAGLDTAGVVLVEHDPAPWGNIERDNRATIEALGATRVLASLPFSAELRDGAVMPERYLSAGRRMLDAIAGTLQQQMPGGLATKNTKRHKKNGGHGEGD